MVGAPLRLRTLSMIASTAASASLLGCFFTTLHVAPMPTSMSSPQRLSLVHCKAIFELSLVSNIEHGGACCSCGLGGSPRRESRLPGRDGAIMCRRRCADGWVGQPREKILYTWTRPLPPGPQPNSVEILSVIFHHSTQFHEHCTGLAHTGGECNDYRTAFHDRQCARLPPRPFH